MDASISDPVLFESVVQHWLLAIDRDCIAVGLSFESPRVCTICKNINMSRHSFEKPSFPVIHYLVHARVLSRLQVWKRGVSRLVH